MQEKFAIHALFQTINLRSLDEALCRAQATLDLQRLLYASAYAYILSGMALTHSCLRRAALDSL